MFINVKKFKKSNFKDHRGYYWTSWKKNSIKKINFVHDKFSLSKKNVLRGLHGDSKTWKLISCPYGKFLLVVVNCIKNSKEFDISYFNSCIETNRLTLNLRKDHI